MIIHPCSLRLLGVPARHVRGGRHARMAFDPEAGWTVPPSDPRQTQHIA